MECIAEEATSGDAARLEELYRLHGADIARWSARLGGPRADVDDLVQEVFLVIADKFKEFRGDAKITTWLFRITENVVRNRRRRERRWGWLKLFGDPASRGLPVTAPDPAEAFERDEAKARVYRVLDALSDTHRSTLILFEIDGLSGEEIAQLTGVKAEAVWMRLSRARRQFVRHFAEMEGDP